jgi:1-acyl-sn-glycerol-3-phosphate acyltransferase
LPERWIIIGILSTVAWLAVAIGARSLIRNPRGDPATGLALLGMILYARVFQRLHTGGRENIPGPDHPRPIILVANHTAGVDPVLIQACVPFEVRFMMARDMQPRALEWLWIWTGVIPVSRDGADAQAARRAVRYLSGEDEPDDPRLSLNPEGRAATTRAIGVFPEGGIERPARRIMPFLPGVGLLVSRTNAEVLPVVIEGTAESDTAWGSLLRRGRARVTFLPRVRYDDQPGRWKPAQIAEDLRRRFLEHTGWQPNNAPEVERVRA